MKSITQPSGVSHIAIGDIVVSVVNDGVHQASFDDLVTSDRAACESAHLGEFRLAPPWLTINCFVIRSGDQTPARGFRIRREGLSTSGASWGT